ncbi:hypothetical protein ACLB2K_012993 [Fragaria x ananassa]
MLLPSSTVAPDKNVLFLRFLLKAATTLLLKATAVLLLKATTALNPRLPIMMELSPSRSTSKNNLFFISRSFPMWILNSIPTSMSGYATSVALCRRRRLIEVVLRVLVASDGEGVVDKDPAPVDAEEHGRGAHMVRRQW